ncbi:hypothetical protein D3C80_1795580 [compost metagenome]
MADRGEDQVVSDRVDDRRRSGAAVEKYGVVFADKLRGEQADTAFFRDLLGFLVGNKIVGHAVTARIGHHVTAQQNHGRRFCAEIAADGHF